jgi:hypothetical protein
MLTFLKSSKLIAFATRGLIVGHHIMRAFSLFLMAGAVFAQAASASSPVQSLFAPVAHVPASQQSSITLASKNFDPRAAPIIVAPAYQTTTTGTAPASSKSAALTNIAGQLIGSIFTIAGIAAAVVASGIGLKILIASGVGSPYGVGQGIMAMLAAGAGLIFAFAGPQVANMIIGATETGGLGNADPSTLLTLPSGAK